MNIDSYHGRLRDAVSFFWAARQKQAQKQALSGSRDQGSRGSVTGGRQMDGFIRILTDLIRESGLPDACVFRNRMLELPGFFRPTKQWDMLVVVDDHLLLALEAKSQVGPSFGNNFNNRTEEAIGSAVDLWTAYREGAFGSHPRPWLGYLFLLEDCDSSRAPVTVSEPHFEVFPEFRGTSYATRYELLCRKLVRERHYEAAAYILSKADTGAAGEYLEPAPDVSFRVFLASLWSHVSGYATVRGRG
jgi:hypothetical protein